MSDVGANMDIRANHQYEIVWDERHGTDVERITVKRVDGAVPHCYASSLSQSS